MIHFSRKIVLRFLFSMLIGNLFLTSLQAEGIWLNDFNQAKLRAAKENKPILLYFSGSDWCAACIKLKEKIIDTDEFRAYAKNNLLMLLLDFPMAEKNKLSLKQTAHNESLAELYNKDGIFPRVILVNSKGKVLFTVKYNLNSVSEYISSIKEKLK